MDQHATKSAAISVEPAPQETTPLLQKGNDATSRTCEVRVVLRVLFTAWLVSMSFGTTQVPLVFVLNSMTCDEYYKSHPDPGLVADRCKHPEIEAGAAQAVSLVAISTTVFGLANLFLTGWWIKRFGIKSSLSMAVFWPGIRLIIQLIGLEVGAGLGVAIIQMSQFITVLGGPAGYMLSLNSFAAEVSTPAERTGTLGRLVGCQMFGTSVGFLAGGLLADWLGTRSPFRVAFGLFMLSWLYVLICLPKVQGHLSAEAQKKTRSISSFFEPLRMFKPQKWTLENGQVRREYGVLLLGVGAYLAVFATGYISTLLQLYSIDVLDFGTTENGWLICVNCMVRGLFLTLVFPGIITRGRRWFDRRKEAQDKVSRDEAGIPDIPTNPQDFLPDATGNEQEPLEPPKPDSEAEESFQFDLTFTRWSIIVDGILTGAATFVTKGWQVYLVAIILPLASGTGPAAKGTILQMCSPSQRTDALSAISLVESAARMSTVGIFGIVFSAFAIIGKPNLTFACNAAVALLAFVVLCFARFPPSGSRRLAEDEETS